MNARAPGQGGGQARGECRSEQASLPLARPASADRSFPEAQRVLAAGAVGGEHGVARPEPENTREMAGLIAVEDDAPAVDPLRRDREAAHGARAWSSPLPRGTRAGRIHGRRAPTRRPPPR